MAFTYTTARKTIWDALYARINDQVADPLVGSRSPAKWIFESFPDKPLDNRDKYPVLIVGPVTMATDRRTFGKKKARCGWVIDVLSTGALQRDQLTDSVYAAIESYTDTMRGTYGVSKINVTEFDQTVKRGEIKVHWRTMIFEGEYGYTA